MRHRTFLSTAWLAATLILAGGSAQAQVFSFAEHTPGFRPLAEGSRFYANGWHFNARHRFRKAAYWADKMAQHNLGVIWYRGDGVDRDPARAWAWFELSAERDYPEFVGIADAIQDELEPAQRQRGQRILEEELRPQYGDEVAVPRTARRMERERRDVVGSRTGFVGNVTVYDPMTFGTRSGEDYFDPEKWDFHRVMQREKQVFEALARGRVTVGELEFVDDGENETH
ncbi:MAG: hypothetical protein U5L08_11935 [Xanthomonadales bacterium]|nr:hypothetical protein [Xanthomonadales bacterium]